MNIEDFNRSARALGTLGVASAALASAFFSSGCKSSDGTSSSNVEGVLSTASMPSVVTYEDPLRQEGEKRLLERGFEWPLPEEKLTKFGRSDLSKLDNKIFDLAFDAARWHKNGNGYVDGEAYNYHALGYRAKELFKQDKWPDLKKDKLTWINYQTCAVKGLSDLYSALSYIESGVGEKAIGRHRMEDMSEEMKSLSKDERLKMLNRLLDLQPILADFYKKVMKDEGGLLALSRKGVFVDNIYTLIPNLYKNLRADYR